MKHLQNENGQSMVEFALVAPILLLLVFGIIDFGWLFFNGLAIENGAREGARFAAVNAADSTNPGTLQTAIEGQVAPLIPIAHTVNVATSPDGKFITVTVNSDVPVLTPIIGAFFPDNVWHMSSAVEMHIERVI